MNRISGFLLAVGLILGAATASAADLDDKYLSRLLLAADEGRCIEDEAVEMIEEQGPDTAGPIVEAAVLALAQREQQQQLLGCTGDIAEKAIAVEGVDPNDVLEATAAGIGGNEGGAPASLGGIGGGSVGGGAGNASSG